MKKIIYILLAITLFSCGKTPINGKLDGMWQLMEIQYADGTKKLPIRTYYAIQLHLLRLRHLHEGSLREDKADLLIGRFEQTKDSLSFYNIRNYRNEQIVIKAETLALFGLNATTDRFGIEKLTNEKMILKSTNVTLYFRKF